MTRDDIAVSFYSAMVSKEGVIQTPQNKAYQKVLIVRAFELADVFECCKEKTLDEIKLLVHTMLPDEPEPVERGPHSNWPAGSSSSGPQGHVGTTGASQIKVHAWSNSVRGEDDCSGGVRIP